ncbi:MAG: GNAT family N-acetyltransferase [Alphaproteobacteria bacterium]|nr:GNAT family N-acetyltransferase [Alphaproteobacteria bacterium]
MTDDGGATPEVETIRIALGRDHRMIAVASTALGDGMKILGLADEKADGLKTLIESFCQGISADDRMFDEQPRCELALLSRPGSLVVRIDDEGMPWNHAADITDPESPLFESFHGGVVDEVHILDRGRQGNRAEFIVRHRGHGADTRASLDPSDHEARRTAPLVPADAPIRIRPMKPDDAAGVARCVYLSYGYTYDADWVYQPDAIKHMLETGLLHSCVAVSAEDEIVGHLALLKPAPDAGVVESGQAVVDPRYRGHHLLASMKRTLADWAADNGIFGLYSEATAAHPISQKANIDIGAHETGLLLGYIPATVSYRQIENAAENRRRSVVMYYLKTNDAPPRPIYSPDRHRDMIARLFAAGALHGQLARSPGPIESGGITRFDVQVRRDHNQAVISINTYGSDFADTVRRRLHELCLHRLDCIYLDLPLADPATETFGEVADNLGFLFGGIFPNQRRDGDVLRFQYLNNVDVSFDEVSVVSDLGRALLDYVSKA